MLADRLHLFVVVFLILALLLIFFSLWLGLNFYFVASEFSLLTKLVFLFADAFDDASATLRRQHMAPKTNDDARRRSYVVCRLARAQTELSSRPTRRERGRDCQSSLSLSFFFFSLFLSYGLSTSNAIFIALSLPLSFSGVYYKAVELS